MAKFVTIATFDTAPKAELAKNALGDAGISATLADGEIVAMEWMLSNAIGGIKLQVAGEDADRAALILSDHGELGDDLVSDGVSEEELERQAMSEPREYDDE